MEVLILNAAKLSNLLAEYKIVSNVAEAKQLIKNGDVRIGETKVTDDYMIRKSMFSETDSLEIFVKGIKIGIRFI